MQIRKAVIPAAGLGTRVLPATKSMPKEMLNIMGKPAIQYIVEEAVNSGISDIMIITSRGKAIVEDHFDKSPELERILLGRGDIEKYNEICKVSNLANIVYVRQKEARGLGDAVLHAEKFVGDEPFVVLYGDDVICSEKPACKQVCEIYEEFGKGVIGIRKVTEEQIKKYSSVKIDLIRDKVYEVSDMIEKPSEQEIMSMFSIMGRCVLPAEIFKILKKTKPGAGGEIQLTDAMKVLANEKGMIGFEFEGDRYDAGSKLGILKANVELALKDELIKKSFEKNC